MRACINKAIAGDEQAIEQLIQLHKGKLIATAFSYVKNYEDAHDLVQETFVKAFRALPQLKEPAYFSTWLCKICIRECFHYLKRQKRALIVEQQLQQLHLLEQAETASYDHLYEALQQVREDYRNVLTLHYFYDFKIQEIVALLNKPLNTIKVQLHRARLQLKKQLETATNQSLPLKDVKTMLQQQLRKKAEELFTIPASFELYIDDQQKEKSVFMWKTQDGNDSYYVELDQQGNLLYLSQPAVSAHQQLEAKQLQHIAERFLTQHYPQALHFLQLASSSKEDGGMRFKYFQYVGGAPLPKCYCTILLTLDGKIQEFAYGGYRINPPAMPANGVDADTIINQLYEAKWSLKLTRLNAAFTSVPQSGIYLLYENELFNEHFDFFTGHTTLAPFIRAEEEQEEQCIPLPLLRLPRLKPQA